MWDDLGDKRNACRVLVGGYLKEKDYLEDLGIKLKWMLKKQDGSILRFYNILVVKTMADILNTVCRGRLRNPESILSLSSDGKGRGVLTYSVTPWCRVLLEKLTRLQPVKKFPAFYGTRRFITALTSVRHLSLSWASAIQSTYPHPTSWRSILILSTHVRLGLPTKTLYFKQILFY